MKKETFLKDEDITKIMLDYKKELIKKGYIYVGNEDYNNLNNKPIMKFAENPLIYRDISQVILRLNGEDCLIDYLIAPTISILNDKGYTTQFCCSGHISIMESDYYSIKEDKILLDFVEYKLDQKDIPFYVEIAHRYELREGGFYNCVTGEEITTDTYILFDPSVVKKLKSPKNKEAKKVYCNLFSRNNASIDMEDSGRLRIGKFCKLSEIKTFNDALLRYAMQLIPLK